MAPVEPAPAAAEAQSATVLEPAPAVIVYPVAPVSEPSTKADCITSSLDTLALIASSVFFGILHMSGRQQWPYMIWATIVGLMLGYSALLTGNLLIPIIAHILTNLISSTIWKWKHSYQK